jgi:hypothetical protein
MLSAVGGVKLLIGQRKPDPSRPPIIKLFPNPQVMIEPREVWASYINIDELGF